jgi:hypothetical protein
LIIQIKYLRKIKLNYASLQQHIENFKLNLAAILLDSPFNTCKYEEEKTEEQEDEGGS